jgi:hypothetical protein
MSHRALRLAATLLACAPAPAEPAPEPVDACAATAPVRLAAPPAGWRPDALHRYGFRRLGEQILYTFDPPDLSDRTYWLVDRCGGAPRRFTSLRTGEPDDLLRIDTDDGAVLYVRDGAGAYHFVDRLDVPGDDEPRPIAGLPTGLQAFAAGRSVLFSIAGAGGTITGAAGLGPDAYHFISYSHAGDPDRPAVHLGDDIIDHAALGDHLLLLHEDGVLRDVDPRTGDGEPLLTGVRRFDLANDDRRLIWQELGDDLAEPVHLLDLDTGEDREIAVNDFTARSWGRDHGQKVSVGTWQFTADSGAAALIGPDDRYVAAVRTDTGEPLPIPAHASRQGVTLADALILLLDDPAQRVEAVWTPLTGGVRVYSRGPADSDAKIRHLDGDLLEYFLPDPTDPRFGPLYRIDLATGRTVRLAPRVGEASTRLADGRYLAIATSDVIAGGAGIYYSHDLDLFDPDTQVYYPIADRVDGYALADQGVFYLDARGTEPGLWLYPLAGE